MADTKISGLTAATGLDATDEFVINDTATPGVSGNSRRATGLMMRTYTQQYLGVPRAVTTNFTVETGYTAMFQPRLTLASTQRGALEGTAELIMSEDFGTRSRLVLAGRG